MTRSLRLLGFSVVALVAGCAQTPPAEDALAEARAAYRAAQSDPHVTQFAPSQLQQAAGTLSSAERLAQQNGDGTAVAHRAYIAKQQARIAQETALARAAEAELARANETRDRVMLEARARQAEERAQQATAAASEAEQQRREAEQQRQETARQAREKQASVQARLDSKIDQLQSQISELKTRKTDRGLVVTLGGDVLFDTGQATLKPGARNALGNFARAVKDEQPRRIIVEGFTDSTGTSELNHRLSEERAAAVKSALVQYGIPAERIVTRGMGEAFPVASNATPGGRQLNRRVEIIVPDEARTADGE